MNDTEKWPWENGDSAQSGEPEKAAGLPGVEQTASDTLQEREAAAEPQTPAASVPDAAQNQEAAPHENSSAAAAPFAPAAETFAAVDERAVPHPVFSPEIKVQADQSLSAGQGTAAPAGAGQQPSGSPFLPASASAPAGGRFDGQGGRPPFPGQAPMGANFPPPGPQFQAAGQPDDIHRTASVLYTWSIINIVFSALTGGIVSLVLSIIAAVKINPIYRGQWRDLNRDRSELNTVMLLNIIADLVFAAIVLIFEFCMFIGIFSAISFAVSGR